MKKTDCSIELDGPEDEKHDSFHSVSRKEHQKMLTVKLHEGLGNQLFQLAAGLGMSIRLNRLLVIHQNRMFRSHQTSTDEAIRRLVRTQFTVLEEREVSKRWYSQKHSKEYIDITDGDEDLIVMDGYWQNIRYFSNCLGLIARKFSALSSEFSEKSGIALHLRLGDYFFQQRNRFHIVTPAYIRKAVSFQLEQGASRKMDVYTDRNSADVARELLERALKGIEMEAHIVMDGNDLDDFVRLTSYDHLIGAPSTFSWWASFLHRNVSTRHTVCFPEQLYHPSFHLSGKEEGFYDCATEGKLFVINDL